LITDVAVSTQWTSSLHDRLTDGRSGRELP